MSDEINGHHDVVFTVRPTNDEIDTEARWGLRGRTGFRAECSACGDFEVGASDEIGDLLRGHVRWHQQLAVAARSADPAEASSR